jgi:hypothetical protein
MDNPLKYPTPRKGKREPMKYIPARATRASMRTIVVRAGATMRTRSVPHVLVITPRKMN